MIEIKVPELGESITEGTISAWIKKEGDAVTQGDVIAEIETDKVNLEISADADGVLAKLLKEEGTNVEIGEVIATLDPSGAAATQKPAESDHDSEAQSPETAASQKSDKQSPEQSADAETQKTDKQSKRRIEATPAARKLAREKGKSLEEIQPSDPMGRVRPIDLQNDSRIMQNAPSPEVSYWDDGDSKEERVRMTRRRQTIAKRLVEAQQTAAMLTTFNEIDMSAVMNLRKRRKDIFADEHGVKLGFMSFFTKAVVGALKAFPLLNAEIDNDEIIMKKYYDIGIAVAAKEGLVVPVVRDADRLSFAGIEKEIDRLAKKAVSNELKLSDLKGGSFTITNGGVFGSLLSTPILNAPQVGILGMHSIQMRPIAIDEERMENRPMMYVALSYDHRIVDGKEAVQFLVRIKNLLEDPETLLLEG